jgi:hypothetical protein
MIFICTIILVSYSTLVLTYSFIFISTDSLIHIYFIGYNPFLFLFIMLFKMSLVWPLESLQVGLWVFLTHPHYFVNTSLSGTTDVQGSGTFPAQI